MRLIDADALIEEIVRIDDLRKLSTATIGKALHVVPTIDAIPVEWLRERKHWAAIDGDHWAENIISNLLDAWQKEQEAR